MTCPPLLTFGGDIHRTSFCEHPAPASPLFAKHRQFAIAVEVLYGDEATGFAVLCKFRFHTGDDTSEDHLLAVGELTQVAQVGTPRVAHVFEYHLIFLQGV